MLWSWISSLPSYNSLLSLESVKPSVSGPPLLFWPETQQHRVSDASALVSSLLWKPHGSTHCCPLSTLYGTWCRENSQGVVQWGEKQDLQYCATAVAWGCCPDWDAFPEDLSQSSEAALIGEYNCGSKSPWSQLLSCRSSTMALRELPLGKAFFFLPLILVRPGLGPLVISFTLYWLLLHRSKWLRGKG